jgi:outer membrane protein
MPPSPPLHRLRHAHRARGAGRLLAWLGAGALALGGCSVLDRKIVPVAELQQRILPPEVLHLPPAEEPTLPTLPEHSSSPPVCRFAPEGPLTLDQAIASAYRLNPGLQALGERIEQARAGKQIVFADFLPSVKTSFRDINGIPGDVPFALPTIPSVIGNVAFGGTSNRYDTFETQLNWLVWDFGRRLARFGQAQAVLDIANFQYTRARQTVAFNAAAAYFAVLDAKTRRTTAEEAVRRAESHLRDARNFLKQGTVVRNDVLRAEVVVSEMQLGLVSTRTAEAVAVAALNQAIGFNVSFPTQLADLADEPPFDLSLAESLQLAVDNREEFRVMLRTIASSELGADIARADFLPRVYAGGSAIHQDGPTVTDNDLVNLGVYIELDVFQGGKRVARLSQARSEVREAVARAKEVCDRIAYEVNASWLAITDARQRIELSRTAVTQAEENRRLVGNLFKRGDATPTEVLDAELVLVRAQQNYSNALYDYQTALARLEFAVGKSVVGDRCELGP